MHSKSLRGDVLGVAVFLSFFVSLFVLTQVSQSLNGSPWASIGAVNVEHTGPVVAETFNNSAVVPCSDQEFSWKARAGGWVNPIVTTKYTRCAVALEDAYFENGSSVPGRIRSLGSDKAFGLEFPSFANPILFPAPNTHSFVVNSWGYQNYYGGTSGLHIIKDYRLTLTDSRFDSEGNKIARPGKPFDFELRGPDGKLVPIRTTGLKFSPNGQWMVFKHQHSSKDTWVRLNLETYEVLSFAKPVQDYYGVHDAISNDGRYVAMYEPLQSLRIYDLERCGSGTDRLVSKQCAHIDIYDHIKAKLGVNEIHFRNLEFKAGGNLSVYIASKRASEPTWKYGEYLLRYGEEATLNGYLAMGDSFSSGEGAYDYRTETDFYVDESLYNLCHQSKSSYPYVLNKAIGFEWFGSVACSGAKVKDIDFGSSDPRAYENEDPQAEGLVGDGIDEHIFDRFLPGYREQKNFLKRESLVPEVVTMTVGGNDIGFGDIVEACVNPLKVFTTCYDNRDKRERIANLVDAQVPSLTKLFKEMKGQVEHPDFRPYVVGYPQIVSRTGKCGNNVGMNDAERKFAYDLVNYLNDAIYVAATKAGAHYVDVSNAFVDGARNYQLCGNQEGLAVNGLVLQGTTSKQPDKINYQESYHPNLLGHAFLASAINGRTDSLTRPMPYTTTAIQDNGLRIALVGDDEKLVDIKKPGYDLKLTKGAATRGKSLEYKSSSDWPAAEPGSKAVIELHSTPIKLGEVAFDAQRRLAGSVVIPGDVEPGYHELHVKYNDFFGESVDRYQIIFVRASEQDYDGDGIINELDPCIMSDQSGVDADKDGVDDACDHEYVENSSEESAQNQNDLVASIIENITVLASYLAETPGGSESSSGVNSVNVAKEHLNDDSSAETPKVQGITTSRKENRVELKEWLSVAGALAAVSTVFLIGSRFFARKMS